MSLDQKKESAIKHLIIVDFITAIIAWLVFWFYRQEFLHEVYPKLYPIERSWILRDYVLSLLIVPAAWIFCYYVSGTYFDLYRKSRVVEIARTLISTIIGSLAIGFIAFANDVDSFKYFFEITSLYFITHFIIVILARLLMLQRTKDALLKGKVKYNTIIVGSNGKAQHVYDTITHNKEVIGNHFLGVVNDIDPKGAVSTANLPVLGAIKDIEQLIATYDVQEIIIALESHEHEMLERILIQLSYIDVDVKVLPDLYDFIAGSIKVNSMFRPVLININPQVLPDWQRVVKRVFDVLISGVTIIVLSPLYIFAIIKTRLSSPGSIFYKQERIGWRGKPFHIIKFRSMYVNAEAQGPQLSSDHDKRITPWGKIMRKWRIDEIPQFFNVFKGEMSLVGPRPERAYFIEQITRTHPHYKYLHRVKPGITSWGMVEYGYAENVQQMIERMRYDLLYIQNCSLILDLKIAIYTVKVLFQGRGK